MSRKLRPDTYGKMIEHTFRHHTGLSKQQVTIRQITDHEIQDCTAGFQTIPAVFKGIGLHGDDIASSRFALQKIYRQDQPTPQDAINIANGTVHWFEKISKDIKNWPTLGELAEFYAELARTTRLPLRLELPRSSYQSLNIRYPRIEMVYVHYATTVVSEDDLSVSNRNITRDKIATDGSIERKLRRPILKRTTITSPAEALLRHHPAPEHALSMLAEHHDVEVEGFTLSNNKELIHIRPHTWEADGNWIELQDRTLSIRGHSFPITALEAMAGRAISDIVLGLPIFGDMKIERATNPRYVMEGRPKDNERQDQPTLRLKLAGKTRTLEKSVIGWSPGPITHPAIKEFDAYKDTLTGPFATTSTNDNLAMLTRLVRAYRLTSL